MGPREGAVGFEVGLSPVDDVDAALYVGCEKQADELRRGSQFLKRLVQLQVLLRCQVVVELEQPLWWLRPVCP